MAYHTRSAGRSLGRLVSAYLLPTLALTLLLNLPRLLELTPWSLLHHRAALRPLLLYQLVHPLLTTVVIPILALTILNLAICRATSRSNSRR